MDDKKEKREYRVGELYHPNVTRWQERIEYNYRSGLHELRMFFSNPHPEEIKAVSKLTCDFRLYVQDELIIFLVRFGQLPWSDAPYTIHMVPEAERILPPPPREHEVVHLPIFLVNADNGRIAAMRAVALGEKFTAALHNAIRVQAALPFDQETYDRHLAQLFARYSADKLATLAQYVCIVRPSIKKLVS